MSCGVGHRLSSDLALLWLWPRPAAAAPIWPLAWEPPYAMGVALKKKNKKLKGKKKGRKETSPNYLILSGHKCLKTFQKISVSFFFFLSNECLKLALFYLTGTSFFFVGFLFLLV